jgi:hypothetical protein
MFPFGRPSEPDRIIDLERFARWVQECRNRKGWSLEILARYLSEAGYPISQNKLYRIEQHLKEKGRQKRPLKTIDYELKIRLETVFGERFITGIPAPEDVEQVSVDSVLQIIENLKEQGARCAAPDHPSLKKIYDAIRSAFVAPH